MATGYYTHETANMVLNMLLRGASEDPPDRVMIGLFTDDPGPGADLNVELSDSNYVRKDAAHEGYPVSDAFDSPEEGETQNAKSIEFNPIEDGEVTVTHFGIFGRYGESSDDDVLMFAAPLYSSRTLEPGDVLTWDQGSVVVSKIDNG